MTGAALPRSKGRTGRPWRRLQRWVWANFTHCFRCGEYVDQTITNPRHPRARSVDHVVALWQGGDELSQNNAVLSHYGCNSSHGAKMRHGKGPTQGQQGTPRTQVVATPSRLW